MFRKLAVATALMSLMSLASGTTLPPVPIEELFREADYVLVVEITDGRTLEPAGYKCGAIYTGRVIESIKGEGDTVSFGHFHGYEIGSKYLVFLTKPDREYRPLMSTNSMAMTREQEFREKCNDVLTGARIMHSGYGVIEITWAIPNDYKDAAKVALRYVVLPESMQTMRYVPNEGEEFDEYTWVAEKDLIDYLKELK